MAIKAGLVALRDAYGKHIEMLNKLEKMARQRYEEYRNEDAPQAEVERAANIVRAISKEADSSYHALAEIERGRLPGSTPEFADIDTLIKRFGIDTLKRYSPKVLTLRKDKVLKIIRSTVVPKQTQDSFRTNYMRLREMRQRAMILMERDRAKKLNSADRMLLDQMKGEIATLRSMTKAGPGGGQFIPQGVCYTFRLERGPYNTSCSVYQAENNTMSAVRRAYHDLLKKISHERMKLRKPRTDSRGHFGTRVKGVYSRAGGVVERMMEKRAHKVFSGKRPQQRNNHVGIELEFCAKLNAKRLAAKLYKAGLDSYVELKADGSLRTSNAGDYTHELCILAPERSYAEVVAKVCAVLKEAGGYVNRSCGMHVHLDMRNRAPDLAYGRLAKSLNIMYAMVPPARRYNKFCVRNYMHDTFRALAMSDSRYWAINASAYNRHKTIEIRLHSGTVNPTRINYWVELLLMVINTQNTVSFKNPDRFIEAFGVRPALAAYIKERVAKFEEEGVEEDDEHVQRIYAENGRESGRACTCSDCRFTRGQLEDDHGSEESPEYEAA